MLKKDKNGFIEIITDTGLQLSDFTAKEEHRSGNPAFVLRYKDSPMEFWYRNSKNSYLLYDCCYTTFAPGYIQSQYIPDSNWADGIEFVYREFKEWIDSHLNHYLEEKDAPDLWNIVSQEDNSYLWDGSDLSFFSGEEKSDLILKIGKFKEQLLTTYQFNQHQLALIDNKLEYLAESVERLNKFDWKGVLIATLIGLATTLSVDKNTGEELFNLAKHIFSEVLILLN